VQIYKSRFPKHKNYGDITTISPEALPEFDLLVGGFPCQSFSIAGLRRGFNDTRGTLFFEIARIIRHSKPRYLLLENVKGLLSHDEGKTFAAIISALDELGYDCQWQVLNSKDFGLAQNRERVYIVGHLRGTARPEVFPIGQGRAADHGIPRHVANTLTARYEGAQATGTYIGEGKLHAPSIRIPEATKRGYTEAHVGQSINLAFQGSKERRGRVSDTSHTLDTGMREHTLTADMRIRRLTPTECERLQGFPDGWTQGGTDEERNPVAMSDHQRYKCLGNAVSVPVVQAIAARLLSATRKASERKPKK
jgi:DNA (cytosine-5)-methyltransferase 1